MRNDFKIQFVADDVTFAYLLQIDEISRWKCQKDISVSRLNVTEKKNCCQFVVAIKATISPICGMHYSALFQVL